ncbi:MAG: SMC-Scp complex subunit ScpB [Planctomycetaceae bacterium]|nr:SMC-Scp complex subunit ScpB [Planctomycetaceae bacterium]
MSESVPEPQQLWDGTLSEEQRLEAVLFLAQEPLTAKKLTQFADLKDGRQVRKLVKNINERYDSASRAFRIYEIAGGFQMRTRSLFASWLCRLHEVPLEVRLSQPAMETLAVIAYKQPVLRATIEKIRGVQCAELIRQLLDQDLVRILGKSEELGKPFLYGTTKHFLEVFGLNHLDELPDRNSMAVF